MILYLIQLSAIWSILLIAFYLFYRNQTYHRFNRWYILLSLLAGIVLPLLPAIKVHQQVYFLTTAFQMSYALSEIAVLGTRIETVNSYSFLLHYTVLTIIFLYLCLVTYKLILFVKEILRLIKFTKEKRRLNEYAFILKTPKNVQPFSFFKTIILPDAFDSDPLIRDIVISHELKHILSGHFYDLLFIQILDILFPYHPCLYFFKREIILVHEYEVDKAVTNQTGIEQYAGLLIHSVSNQNTAYSTLIHTFFHSPIKSRLKMLFKKSNRLNYLAIAFFPFLLIACNFLKSDYERELESHLPNIIKTDSTVETHSNAASGWSNIAPQYPGGEQELMQFIGKNIKYPETGRKQGIQGTSYVKFDVFEDGSIQNKVILRSLGKEFDDELFRVIDLMPKWIPAQKDSMKIMKSYTLPVKFKLDK